MTWVYPADQAAATTRHGLAVASFWVAAVFLVGGASTLITSAVLGGGPAPLLGLASFALLVGLLVVVRVWRRFPLWFGVAIIATGGAVVGILAVGLESSADSPWFPAVAALIGMIALGGNADRWTGTAGVIVGYLVGQAALSVFAPSHPVEVAPALIALIVAVYYAFLNETRRRGRAAADRLDAAARADLVASQRRAFELRSRALVHDTVLSDLVALGMTPPGPLSDAVRASITESLAAVRGPDDAESYMSRPSRALDSVLERERLSGLIIEVTGDTSVLDTLAPATRAALLQAIDQALVNVRKHAGVESAELSVIASGASVVATVVDEGVGFVEADIAADRFGFRESIRGALESVGGAARILSSPGAGTSVLLTAPLTPEADE
ncbi:sensor histidine kinase [Schumannella luteola]